jgi:hypothetical protein
MLGNVFQWVADWYGADYYNVGSDRDLPATLESMADDARHYIAAAKAPATLRAYRSDWAHLTTWCDTHDRRALRADADTVALYLTDLARVAKPVTLQRRLSSISQAHQAAGHAIPTGEPVVRAVHAGLRRSMGNGTEGEGAGGDRGAAGHGHRSPRRSTRGPGSGHAAGRLRGRAAAPRARRPRPLRRG